MMTSIWRRLHVRAVSIRVLPQGGYRELFPCVSNMLDCGELLSIGLFPPGKGVGDLRARGGNDGDLISGGEREKS